MKNIGYQFIIVILSLISIFLNFETIEKKDYYNVRVSEGYTNIGLPTNPNMSGFATNKTAIQNQPVANTMNVPPVLKEEAYLSAAFDYSLGDARLVGEAGVMKTDIALTINPIEDNELPPLNQGMVNVTGDNSGYRMLPKGMVFRDDINIILPYDSTLLPMGFTPNDIKTYFYHDTYKRWIEIERDSIDENNQLVISKVNHFTDFINAVLKTPEMPETSAYTPTQMNDIGSSSPFENMSFVSPPLANNNGTVNMNYPIWIPNGRNGMQPSLSVSYNGGKSSNWIGVGWDIPIPKISVETGWGVPRYSPTLETEIYLYNGEQLITKNEEGNIVDLPNKSNQLENRSQYQTEKQFFPRVELRFDSIVRYGTNPTNYWWSVTDKNGTTHFYGKQKNSDLVDLNSVLFDNQGNIASWGITESVDINGNTIRYYYSKTFHRGVADPSAQMGSNLYIDSINYTGFKTATSYTHGLQTVIFVRKNGRPDVTISGNYGFKLVDQCQLCNIHVEFYGPKVYEYPLLGTTGPIVGYNFRTKNNRDSRYKTLLTDIYKIDYKVNTECVDLEDPLYAFNGTRTNFEYFDYPDKEDLFSLPKSLPANNDNIESFFATSPGDISGDFKATALGASQTKSWGIGGNAYLGLGYFFTMSTVSVGGNFDYSRSSTNGALTLLDLNGDGLIDKLYRKKVNGNWHVYYRKQLPQITNNSIYSSEIELDDITTFLHETSDNINWGLQASAIVSLSGSWGSSWSRTSIYFSDVNADGLPDLITDEGVLFNSLNPITGNPTFKNIYKEQIEDNSNENPEYIVSSASEPCGGIIFDGQIDDRIACHYEYTFDTILTFIITIDSSLLDQSINNFAINRLNYGYYYIDCFSPLIFQTGL